MKVPIFFFGPFHSNLYKIVLVKEKKNLFVKDICSRKMRERDYENINVIGGKKNYG